MSDFLLTLVKALEEIAVEIEKLEKGDLLSFPKDRIPPSTGERKEGKVIPLRQPERDRTHEWRTWSAKKPKLPRKWLNKPIEPDDTKKNDTQIARQSLKEERKAIRDYKHRKQVAHNSKLKGVLGHAIGEEKDHAKEFKEVLGKAKISFTSYHEPIVEPATRHGILHGPDRPLQHQTAHPDKLLQLRSEPVPNPNERLAALQGLGGKGLTRLIERARERQKVQLPEKQRFPKL